MANHDFILHACTLEKNKKGTPLENDELHQAIQDERLAWIHLDANNPKTTKWLHKEIQSLDPLIIEALLAEETRPRILEFETGALMILRGVNLNENANPEDMISIRLWISPNAIISIQRRPLKAVKDIHDLAMSGKGPKNAGDFIAMLSARLFERMEPIFSALDEQLDDIEELIIEDPNASERQNITRIRKQAIMFRRYIAPQRDVMTQLRNYDHSWLDLMHRRRLQESLDRVTRYLEDLDTIRERAQIVKDELGNALSDRMNRNLYMLSVIAAIFMPLGFLTGLLGINVGGIPGADNTDAFMIFCGILGAIILAQVILFKKLKWF